MRNYFFIEKTDEGIFISEGKGTTPPKIDETKYWNKLEKMENEEMLFARIKELLDKN